jgi:hypothetical protein
MWHRAAALAWYSASSAVLAAPGDPTVRILTAYTPEAASQLPGGIASVVTVQLWNLNSALSDSGVRLNVESAGAILVSGLPTVVQSLDHVIAAAQWKYQLLRERDDRRADVVMIIHETNLSGGIARKIGATKASEAFAVVEPNALSQDIYQHEFGHILGARHQSSGGLPQSTDDKTTGTVGKGWYIRKNAPPSGTAPVDYCGKTIMAYPSVANLSGVACVSAAEWKALMFSTPHRCWDTGDKLLSPSCLPWGDATHNNAQVISSFGATVSTFRNTKLATLLVQFVNAIVSLVISIAS